MKHGILHVLGGVLAVTLAGCGGGGNEQSPDVGLPTYTADTAPARLLADGQFTDFASAEEGRNLANATKFVPFTVEYAGSTVRAQVNWTRVDDEITATFYADGCLTLAQLGAAPCQPYATSVRPDVTKAGTVASMGSVRAGRYVLVLQNKGPQPESGAFQVVGQD